MSRPAIIGARLPRPDAYDKVRGRATYADDIELPGMLHGALLRSPHPHARIKRIDTRAARALPGVKDVVTGADTPQVHYGNWRLIPKTQDELPLCVDKVRFVGDEVAAVCALDRQTAVRACELIEVQYEPLPAVFEVEAAIADGAPEIHTGSEGNVSLTRKIAFGDVEAGFAAADYLREDEYRVGAVSHAYLEPCASLAAPDESGRVTLWTSTQVPYIVQCLLASTLGLHDSQVRVIKPEVGGAFGGKMELRPWEFCAAFMTLRTGRPVKFRLDRSDELAFGRRRHPMTLRLKTGFFRDGRLAARDFQVLIDGGAYNAMGPTCTFLCGNFGAMLYRFPAYRYFGRHIYTNKPPASAMRGFGAPQALFASESQLNAAAVELGIDPIELRLKNAMVAGDVLPEVATISSAGFEESLQKVREMSGWTEKRQLAPSGARPGYGIGVGCYSFISGGVFNWFNTKYNFATCEVRLFEDGTAHLLTMAAEIGQGCNTVLRQILAAELGIEMKDIRLTAGDTAITPKADLGTWGSRVTMMAGNAVIEAARKVKDMLAAVLFAKLDLNQIHEVGFGGGRVFVKARPERGMPLAECAYLALRARRGKPLSAFGGYTPRGKGLVTPAFSFGAQVAEVQLDAETGLVEVERIYTAHDCGVPINRMAVEGQLEGSIHMGLGYALSEQLVMREGRTLNTSFLDYKIPAAEDMPASESVEVEVVDPEGPYGAKEAGEGLVSPTAPAIAEAVWQATGYRATELPITPERILRATGKL